MGASVAVAAYGFAGIFRLRELTGLFPPEANARIEKDQLVARYDGTRWAIVYDFGALVFVGVEPAVQAAQLEIFRRQLKEPHPLTETFSIDVAEGAPLEVRFDRVVAPSLSFEVVDIVALVLAQSVAMDYYAQDVAEIETATDRIADELRSLGRIPGPVRNLQQFIGLCIATRNDVISTLALFDKPDSTWENEQLDRLWSGLHKMLEIDDRYRALEAKLRMFQDNLVVLVDLSRQRHTILLEWTVVILILGEMLIMMWQLWHSAGHP
jgi:uncharacterized Rmd1/YagE family protein